MDEVKGWEIPIHGSLTKPILMGGAPRKFSIFFGTISAAIVIGFHFILYIPVAIIIHFLGVYAAKRDPEFFDILINHLRDKTLLEP